MTATTTAKGQITIPLPLRQKFHLSVGDQIEFGESAPVLTARRVVNRDVGSEMLCRARKLVWSASDALRFCNWMHNGQGGGSTESRACDMTQPVSTIIHSVSASVWIPTENEWYKAAYYQPVGTVCS